MKKSLFNFIIFILMIGVLTSTFGSNDYNFFKVVIDGWGELVKGIGSNYSASSTKLAEGGNFMFKLFGEATGLGHDLDSVVNNFTAMLKSSF